MSQAAVAKRHYPYVTRILLSLLEEGRLRNVERVEVEPEYGYVTRIYYNNGSVRVTRGSDVGLNPGAACEIAKDKAYTKFFLRKAGFACPEGRAFLLPWWAEKIIPGLGLRGFDAPLMVDQAADYAASLGFPVYVKPVDGARGQGVWRCDDLAEMERVIADYAEQWIRVALIEEYVDMPDHRLVVMRGGIISAYSRLPLTVTGDGVSTTAELLRRLQQRYTEADRDTLIDVDDARIAARLRREGRTLESVPRAGEPVVLLDISNLSAGGTAHDVTAKVHPFWSALAADVAKSFGLAFCGIDLACHDLAEPGGRYSIIEVNATAGLDNYGSVGRAQRKIVRDLYALVLNEPT
ncbi:hypothetical protein [Actinomadura sp. 21ATH]|uniref:hypothetical protein n=1 Tax=Actinomadura sp. 21ATH TaxID=1735444 RepID=UPI0035C08925